MQLIVPTQQLTAVPQLVKPRAPFLFGIEQTGLASTSTTATTPPSPSSTPSNRLIFPPTLLGTSSALSMTLQNLSPVPLPFQWLTPFDDRYSSLLPLFHCYPFSGTLHPLERRDLVLTFTPRAAGVGYVHCPAVAV